MPQAAGPVVWVWVVRVWLVPVVRVLLCSDLLSVVTVGGIASRALLRRDAFGTLDPIPPTARELGIAAKQERLNNPLVPQLGLMPIRLLWPGSVAGCVALSLVRC